MESKKDSTQLKYSTRNSDSVQGDVSTSVSSGSVLEIFKRSMDKPGQSVQEKFSERESFVTHDRTRPAVDEGLP